MTQLHKYQITELSFVTKHPSGKIGGGLNYWTVEPTGDYSKDCQKGRELAEEFLTYIGKYPTNGNASLLQCIVDSMIAARSDHPNHYGKFTTGLEVAFLATINEFALVTAKFVVERSGSAQTAA